MMHSTRAPSPKYTYNSTKTQNNIIEIEQKTLIDISPKKTYKCPVDTQNDAQHH